MGYEIRDSRRKVHDVAGGEILEVFGWIKPRWESTNIPSGFRQSNLRSEDSRSTSDLDLAQHESQLNHSSSDEKLRTIATSHEGIENRVNCVAKKGKEHRSNGNRLALSKTF